MLQAPDLSSRPHQHTVEHEFPVAPHLVYSAWTNRLDSWFAAPGAVAITAEVDAPYYFEVQVEGARHPHYGRFLRLEPDHLIELTWLNGTGGTSGAETVVTIELTPVPGGTHLKLTHAGFYDEEANRHHAESWPHVLDHLEQRLNDMGQS